jgi:multiple sugar transport system permease protein
VAAAELTQPRRDWLADRAQQFHVTASALLLPAAGLMLVFLLGPIAVAVWLSFTDEALTGIHALSYGFVGTQNYGSLLHDSLFAHSLTVTAIYVVGSVAGQTLVGLISAYLMRRRAHRLIVAFVGSTMIGAWIIPEIVAAFLWFTLAAGGGTLDRLLKPFGLGHVNWLVDLPLVLVSIATVWGGAALSMLIFAAGLRNIPDELTEAAVVDGAHWWQRVWHVELPVLRRTFAINLILVTLTTLTDFTMIYALTGGGPGNATQTLPQYVFQQAVSFGQLGYGNAAAVVLLFIAAFVCVVYVRLLRVEV